MIDFSNTSAFYDDNSKIEISIVFEDGHRLSSSDLDSESFEVKSILCSDRSINFGNCNSTEISFMTYDMTRVTGQTFAVSFIVNSDSSHPIKVGTFKAISDRRTSDRTRREIIGYDAMYDIINADVASWYNTILPNDDVRINLKQFRDSFINHFNLDAEEVTLCNDDLTIKRAIEPEALSGASVMYSICEINGVFGTISNNGKVKYVELTPDIEHSSKTIEIDNSVYYGAEYEEFVSEPITKLIIRTSNEDDKGIEVGSGDNTYYITGNILVKGYKAKTITKAANKVLDKIKNRGYCPCKIQAIGNPIYELGDPFKVQVGEYTVYSYIFERTLRGITAMEDTYEAHGGEKSSEDLNSVSTKFKEISNDSGSGTGILSAYLMQNNFDFSIASSEQTVIQNTFNTNDGTGAVFAGQARIESSADAIVTVRYYLNNELEDYYGEHTVVANGMTMLPLYKNFLALNKNTDYVFKIGVSVSSGTVHLETLALNCSLICYKVSEIAGIVGANDIAIAHTAYESTHDVIWAAFVENNRLRVKYAQSDATALAWTELDIPRIVNPSAISMAFNSQIVGSDNYFEFVTEEYPYIAYVKSDAIYLLNILTGERTLMVNGNVKDVSLVRAPKVIQTGKDYGFVMFFLMENQIYYRQMIDGVWYDAEVVDVTLEDGTVLKNIEAFTTWDYRTGILVTTEDGDMFQIISYFEGLSDIMQEHIELSISAQSELIPIQYRDVKSADEHIELSISTISALIYGLSAIVTSVENIEDADENWGTTVRLTFDYPVYSDGLTESMFMLVDTAGNNYICEGFEIDDTGYVLTLTFADFNLAGLYDNVTVSYTKPTTGGLMSPATQTDSFEETFVPENLVPPASDPPAFDYAETNEDGNIIYLHLTEPVTNADVSGMMSNFTVSLQEYNYVPGGSLQNTTRTVKSMQMHDGTVVSMSSGTLTNVEIVNSKLRLEVDSDG